MSRSISEVQECLGKHGFDIQRGERDQTDTNAADAELIIAAHDAEAFLGFYESTARIERLEPEVRSNAKTISAEVERLDRVLIVWTKRPSDKARSKVTNCVAPSS